MITNSSQERRHALRASLATARVPAVADAPPARLALERGAAWPLLIGAASLGEGAGPRVAAAAALFEPLLADDVDPAAADVRDGAGHGRAAYKGLLGYALFGAVRESGRDLSAGRAAAAGRWVQALGTAAAAVVATLPADAGPIPAAAGAAVAGACWAALGARAGGHLLGDDRAVREAAGFLAAVVDRQRPAGPYLAATAADNPETLWYHELQIVHAVASYGLQARNAAALASARRAAAWHQAETQPDHATNLPWGLTAFLLDPGTEPTADGLLHAAAVQHPDRRDPVTLILRADALYSLGA